ncbi:peptide-methionine (S)-S-oxide reductase MsrA [Pontibacter liquoris]|uniref:peptide-methionine (S)-S-oxide reductase MsrA n=1 Tax=Pontibacter liquoris TaxID=2905677 RepID=UPI001FA6B44D|nr:peptide-methionine (S)-S-oxide reductase MsrA [Pontibacter liquoris]
MSTQFRFLILPFLVLFNVACSQAASDNKQAAGEGQTTKKQEAPLDTTGLEKATFAGGCFWCTEGYFERLKGIKQVVSGYAGGKKPHPTYEEVSSGTTGYAEAVQIYFDPKVTSYQDLLKAFFISHDPTTLNRQGPDEGTQYRSVVFYHTPEQKKEAEQYITQLQLKGTYPNKIVTTVEPFTTFWEAEDYHQDFYERNPDNPYIQQVAKPKMKKFEKAFHDKLKDTTTNE